MKRGKKYIEAAKLIERGNLYDKDEAVALVKKSAVAKFDETIEAHIRTGCDGRHADQQIRGAVVLPHGTGKVTRILVFAKGAKADEAQALSLIHIFCCRNTRSPKSKYLLCFYGRCNWL